MRDHVDAAGSNQATRAAGERRPWHWRNPILAALGVCGLMLAAFALRDTSETTALGVTRDRTTVSDAVHAVAPLNEPAAPAGGDDPDPAAVTPGAARPAAQPPARATGRGAAILESAPSASDRAADASEAPAAGPPFDERAARAILSSLTAGARRCKDGAAPGTEVTVAVTFLPSGEAKSAVVTGTFEGTEIATCLERIYQDAHVAPFAGAPRKLYHSYSLR